MPLHLLDFRSNEDLRKEIFRLPDPFRDARRAKRSDGFLTKRNDVNAFHPGLAVDDVQIVVVIAEAGIFRAG